MRSKAVRTVGIIIGGLAVLSAGLGLVRVRLHQGKLHDGQLYLARHRTAVWLSDCC